MKSSEPIETAQAAFEFATELKNQLERAGDSKISQQLSRAFGLGSSTLEVLGGIQHALIENKDELLRVLGTTIEPRLKEMVAFVDQVYGRKH